MIHHLIPLLAVLGAIALCLTVSPIIKGITTIRWGTGSTIGTPSAVIARSVRITPKNGAAIELEDNNGFCATYVILDDGFDAEAVVTYDTALTWPAVGDTVVLTIPKIGAAGGVSTFNCTLLPYGEDLERKAEATLTMKFMYRPNAPVS